MSPRLAALFFSLILVAADAPLLGQRVARLNGHAVALDAQGKLLSWVKPQERAYGHVVKLAWDFISNKVPVESNGRKTYLTHATFDPATLRGTDWPHNPAGLYAMFVLLATRSSGRKYTAPGFPVIRFRCSPDCPL